MNIIKLKGGVVYQSELINLDSPARFARIRHTRKLRSILIKLATNRTTPLF
jgi:hypothetical protein